VILFCREVTPNRRFIIQERVEKWRYMPSRRTVVTTGTVGLFGITAGCLSSLQTSSPEAELVGIILRNVDDERHVLELRLSHNEKIVVNKQYALKAQTVGNSDSDHVAAVDSVWESSTGTFTAKVRLDGDGRWSSLQLNDDVSGQYKYEIRITEHGEIEGWNESSEDQ
jgi:hypothetical protein